MKITPICLFCLVSFQLLCDTTTPLRLLSSEKIPYNYSENEHIQGISIDIVQALLPDQKVALETEMLPWPRAFDIAAKTPELLVFTMGKTAERERMGFSFIGPVSTRQHFLYSIRTDLPEIQSYQDIRRAKLVVAGLRGGWLSSSFKQHGIPVHEVGNYQQGVQMLLLDRAQLWLSTDLEAEMHLKLAQTKVPLHPVWLVRCSGNYLGLSPQTSETTRNTLLQKYKQWSSGQAPATLLHKWQKKLGFPLTFSATTGFMLKAKNTLPCPLD